MIFLLAGLFVFYIIDIVQIEITNNNTRCVQLHGEGYAHENIDAQRLRDVGISVTDEDITNDRSKGACRNGDSIKEFTEK